MKRLSDHINIFQPIDASPATTRIEPAEFLARQAALEESEFTERLLRSGIPPRLIEASLANFTVDLPAQRDARKLATEYAMAYCRPNKAPARSALFYGPPGTGKTHLAVGIMRTVGNLFGVRYTTVSDLARAVRSTYHRKADQTEQDVLEAHVSPSLLTIDEIGVGLGTDHERAMLHDVVAKRYDNQRPTILISNLSLEAVRSALGERLVDRLREDNGLAISFSWPSFRGAK